MKRSTKIILASVLTIGVASGALAYGKHRFEDPATRIGFMTERMSEKLNLNESQDAALDNLRDVIISSKEKVHDKENPMKKQFIALITADNFDKDQALKLITEKTTAINESAPGVVSAMGDFLNTLDADQKAQIAKFLEKGPRHGKGPGKHHGHHGDDEHRGPGYRD